VREGSYYAWLRREPSARAIENTMLLKQIKDLWHHFRGIYGAPRIWSELVAGGVKVGLKRVAPNLLNRQFKGHQRNQIWVSDITYIDTHEGWLYVAAVLDLGSCEIVGLAMADHMRGDLTLDALNMALVQQRPAPGLMHHSDRGSQYTAHAYQQRLRDAKMLVSMSRKGKCWDNAPMESFWATLKRECAFTLIYMLALLFLAISWASIPDTPSFCSWLYSTYPARCLTTMERP